MNYSYNDLKEKYEVYYVVRHSRVKEIFGFEKLNNLKNEEEVLFTTVEEAKKELLKNIKEDNQREENYYNSRLDDFENESWLYKLRMRKKVESYYKRKKEELKLREDNVIVDYKDRGTYKIGLPQIVKNDDILYVAVDKWNGVNIGVYEAKVSNVSYYYAENNIMTIRASYNIEKDGEVHTFSFNDDNDMLKSGHAYHHLFFDKNDAINCLQKYIKEKIEYFSKMVVEVENDKKVQKSIKP